MDMTPPVDIKIVRRLPDGSSPLPAYATPGSAALDLVAAIDEPVVIVPGTTELIGTGIAVHMKSRHMAAILASRSGLFRKHRMRVGQGIGLIDADYQGEIGVMVDNAGDEDFTVTPGMRLSQLFFVPILHPAFREVESFDEVTERGEGGFGHTGQ